MTHIDIKVLKGVAEVNIDGMEVIARDVTISKHFFDDRLVTEIHLLDFSDNIKPLYFSVSDNVLIQEIQRRAKNRKWIAEQVGRIALNECDLNWLIEEANKYKNLTSE